MLNGDTERIWREYLTHTPLVQSVNQSEVWGEVHRKRGFSWGKSNGKRGKTA